MSRQWIDRVHLRKPPKWITLDMDSSVSPTHGAQEGTALNGHFGCMCYHPLFVFIIRFYIQRGTSERYIKEGEQAINWTGLSCMGLAQNEVRLQLYTLAYNPGAFLQSTGLLK